MSNDVTVEFADNDGAFLQVNDEGGFFYLWTEQAGATTGPIVSIEAGDLVHLAHRLMAAAFAAMEQDEADAPP